MLLLLGENYDPQVTTSHLTLSTQPCLILHELPALIQCVEARAFFCLKGLPVKVYEDK